MHNSCWYRTCSSSVDKVHGFPLHYSNVDSTHWYQYMFSLLYDEEYSVLFLNKYELFWPNFSISGQLRPIPGFVCYTELSVNCFLLCFHYSLWSCDLNTVLWLDINTAALFSGLWVGTIVNMTYGQFLIHVTIGTTLCWIYLSTLLW